METSRTNLDTTKVIGNASNSRLQGNSLVLSIERRGTKGCYGRQKRGDERLMNDGKMMTKDRGRMSGNEGRVRNSTLTERNPTLLL